MKSKFGDLADVNGTLFFSAFPGAGALWKSDGTEAGTTIVKAMSAGGPLYPDSLTNVDGTLYFVAGDAEGHMGLWRSDGTATGTSMITPVQATSLTAVGNRLFFIGQDDLHGRELWKSDGTLQGTTLMKDINPGPIGTATNSIRQVTSDGWALFAASNGLGGVELWRSDGSAEGTQPLQDIAPGASSSNPTSFLAGFRRR